MKTALNIQSKWSPVLNDLAYMHHRKLWMLLDQVTETRTPFRLYIKHRLTRQFHLAVTNTFSYPFSTPFHSNNLIDNICNNIVKKILEIKLWNNFRKKILEKSSLSVTSLSVTSLSVTSLTSLSVTSSTVSSLSVTSFFFFK